MDFEYSKTFAATLRSGANALEGSKVRSKPSTAPHPAVTAGQLRLEKTTQMFPGPHRTQKPTLTLPDAPTLTGTSSPSLANQINQTHALANRVTLSGPAFSHTHSYTYTNSSTSAASAASKALGKRRIICGKTNRERPWVAARRLAAIVPQAGSPNAQRDPRGALNNPLLVGVNDARDWQTFIRERRASNPTKQQLDGSGESNDTAASDSDATKEGSDSTEITEIQNRVTPLELPQPQFQPQRPRTLRKIVDMPWCPPTSLSLQASGNAQNAHTCNIPAWWPQGEQAKRNDATSDDPTEEDLAAVRRATALLAKELGSLNTRSWFQSIPPPATCDSVPVTMTLPEFMQAISKLGWGLTRKQTRMLTSMFFSQKPVNTTEEQGHTDGIAKPLEYNHLVSRLRCDAGYVPHITKYAALMAPLQSQAKQLDMSKAICHKHEDALALLQDHLRQRRASEAAALGIGLRTSYKQVEDALSLLNIKLAEGELAKLCAALDPEKKGYVSVNDILSRDALPESRSSLSRAKAAEANERSLTVAEQFERQRHEIDPGAKYRIALESNRSSKDVAQRKAFETESEAKIREQSEAVWQPPPPATRFGLTYVGRLNTARVVTPGLDPSATALPYAKAGQIKSVTGGHMDVADEKERYKPREQAIAEMQAEDRAMRNERKERIIRAKQQHEAEVVARCEERDRSAESRSDARTLGLIATRLRFCEALEQRTNQTQALQR